MNTKLLAPLVLATAVAISPTHASTTPDNAPNQYVQVNGNKIAYRYIGSGSPIVLANRMRGTLDTWDPVFLDKLAERHTVITFDYPGVGYSAGALPGDMGQVASFVNDFTTAIKLDKFAMLGWSWGGFTTQTLLLDQPERVTHAILVGTNPPGPGQIPIQKVFIERAMKPVNDLDDEEVLFFDPKSEFSRTAAKASRERIYARPDVVSKIPSKMEQFQVYLKAAEVFGEDKLGRRAKLIQSRTPMLIISGDNDTSTAGQNWFPLIGQLGNAQFVFYPESGHGPQHQYPELSAEYIADFIARTSK
jgi:pimeloyl-ACP methyl ester carboxylesterase